MMYMYMIYTFICSIYILYMYMMYMYMMYMYIYSLLCLYFSEADRRKDWLAGNLCHESTFLP